MIIFTNGHQPMLSDNGRLAVVFNGEIYNFREWEANWRQKGIIFVGLIVKLALYHDQGLR